VLKAGMQGAGIHVLGHSPLFDAPQPLEAGMFDDIEYEFTGNGNEAVNRVVKDFLFVQSERVVEWLVVVAKVEGNLMKIHIFFPISSPPFPE
jgi:hypothetical protein